MHAAGHIKRASVLFEDEKLTVAQFNLDGNSESARAGVEHRACSQFTRASGDSDIVSLCGDPPRGSRVTRETRNASPERGRNDLRALREESAP